MTDKQDQTWICSIKYLNLAFYFFFTLKCCQPGLFLSFLLSFLSLSPPFSRAPLFPADPEWSLHDSAERPCSGLYIWGCHVRISGAAKLGDAFKSQQLPLPRAQAYSLCGLAGLPSKRVGNFTQLPQSLHLTCECLSSPVVEKKIRKKIKSHLANEAMTFWVPGMLKRFWFDPTLFNWMITPWELSEPPLSRTVTHPAYPKWSLWVVQLQCPSQMVWLAALELVRAGLTDDQRRIPNTALSTG